MLLQAGVRFSFRMIQFRQFFSDLIWLEALIASCVMCRFEFGILPTHIWFLRQFQIIWFREFESDRKLESLQWYSIHWKRGGNYVGIEKLISCFLNCSLIALPPVCSAPTMPLPIYCLQNTFKITFNIAFKIAFNIAFNIALNIASKNVLKIAWDHLWHLVAGTLVLVCCHWTWKAAC